MKRSILCTLLVSGTAFAGTPGATVEVNAAPGADAAYRVESVHSLGPLGTEKIMDIPNSIAILPASLIQNTQAKNVKQALKYLPLVQFQEQQGPEILRPATRGMQGSNYQNTRLDGMTIFITGANAIEAIEQIEVLSGLPAAVFGPSNPAGGFNFVSKRPTGDPLRQLNVGYESASIYTAHADVGGMFGSGGFAGYRVNLLDSHGTGYVSNSSIDRKLASLAIDVHPTASTTIELTGSNYRLVQKGYPGWFTYGQTINLPSAPDPTRVGYGQSYAGVDLKNQIGNIRLLQNLGPNWLFVVGALTQKVDRNINTPVNNLTSNSGAYTSSFASGFAPFFGITSDIAYLNGRFQTGGISHDLTLGTTGVKATSNAVLNAPTTVLGTANINNPTVFPEPLAGPPDVVHQYRSSLARQQGINLSDTLVFTPKWSVKVAVSQDWMQTRNFNSAGAQTTTYNKNGLSPMPSIIFKPRENVTSYLTYASSLQQGDIAPGTATVTNRNQALAPYRSTQWEAGIKVSLPKIDLTLAAFRLERPFANVDPADNTFKIVGQQINKGLEASAIGMVSEDLKLVSGVTLLNPILDSTGKPATNDKQYVGMPKFKSNILLEYAIPAMKALVLCADWQYTARRPGNDANTTWAPSYSVLDAGARYTARIREKAATWRVSVNNLTDERYWSTIGPATLTGAGSGNMTAHLGSPRTVTASMSIDF